MELIICGVGKQLKNIGGIIFFNFTGLSKITHRIIAEQPAGLYKFNLPKIITSRNSGVFNGLLYATHANPACHAIDFSLT